MKSSTKTVYTEVKLNSPVSLSLGVKYWSQADKVKTIGDPHLNVGLNKECAK